MPRHSTGKDGPGWVWDSIPIEGQTLYFRRNDTSGDHRFDDHEPIVHLHGFGISGTYLMPTARRLAGRCLNIVPDLPGYGRSPHPRGAALGITTLADRVMALIQTLELPKVVLLGNSMGCPIALEVAHRATELVSRLILVSPAGGVHNQPLTRALGQLVRDGTRERPSMARVAVPDYVRFGPINMLHLFGELTRFPSMERLLRTPVPTLAVLGDRDPLMPPPHRVREVASLAPDYVSVVVIGGAAHALNFSHPGELAHVVGQWLDGEDITHDPDEPGATLVPAM